MQTYICPADATATHCLLLQYSLDWCVTFLVPAHLGSPGKGQLHVSVCVCVYSAGSHWCSTCAKQSLLVRQASLCCKLWPGGLPASAACNWCCIVWPRRGKCRLTGIKWALWKCVCENITVFTVHFTYSFGPFIFDVLIELIRESECMVWTQFTSTTLLWQSTCTVLCPAWVVAQIIAQMWWQLLWLMTCCSAADRVMWSIVMSVSVCVCVWSSPNFLCMLAMAMAQFSMTA